MRKNEACTTSMWLHDPADHHLKPSNREGFFVYANIRKISW